MIRLTAIIGVALLAMNVAVAQSIPTRIVVNGVELHYISEGSGETLILLHGGQGDYRSWEPQMRELSRYYRVISYSRRYNFPNRNPQTAVDHSAIVEAADLAALIKALGLKRVNLIGTSMGAATALTLAVEHPRMVRTLVIAEPPILGWAREFADGGALYRDFMQRIQDPARDAFVAGDDTAAMRFFVDGLASRGRFDSLSAEARLAVMQNAAFFRMMTRSQNPYPDLSRKEVRELRMPVLVITGEKTVEIHRRIDEELSKLIPRARSATIPNAGHGSPRENPQAFTEVVENFLETSG
ncbi:MAG TPA: alpha/beta hydrolase [Steroidobacteraceae bacterium]|jgi:pimeloyl-ACP methyl ester carboxylesterase|nr:alpha/beta hydrolase [Steroidobacteraceae bacterium]